MCYNFFSADPRDRSSANWTSFLVSGSHGSHLEFIIGEAHYTWSASNESRLVIYLVDTIGAHRNLQWGRNLWPITMVGLVVQSIQWFRRWRTQLYRATRYTNLHKFHGCDGVRIALRACALVHLETFLASSDRGICSRTVPYTTACFSLARSGLKRQATVVPVTDLDPCRSGPLNSES